MVVRARGVSRPASSLADGYVIVARLSGMRVGLLRGEGKRESEKPEAGAVGPSATRKELGFPGRRQPDRYPIEATAPPIQDPLPRDLLGALNNNLCVGHAAGRRDQRPPSCRSRHRLSVGSCGSFLVEGHC
ncbi:hypothetical protein MRX96_011259 [Rhipicephalus microplus]